MNARPGIAPLALLASLAAIAAGAAGCDQASLDVPPPLDRTFFPTGLALHRLPGGRTALLVASSNFDLTYARERGGTLLAIDAEASQDGQLPVVLGGVVIDSFAGEVAVVDPSSCADLLGGAVALVPTRFGNDVHAVDVAADGALDCGETCRIPLSQEFRSAFSVAPSCGTALGPRAWVSHLEARPSADDGLVHGWVSEIDLNTRTVARTIDLGAGRSTVRTVRWDAGAGRLYATPVASTAGFSALRWLYPTGPIPEDPPFVNFDDLLRNGVAQDIALSTDRRKLYVTAVLNDPSFLATAGVLVPVSGALVVLEVIDGARGDLGLRLLRAVPMGLGPGPLHVIPRTGRGDLVVVADTSGSEVFIYDDDSGAVVKTFGRDETPGSRFAGRPIAGRQPFGLASEQVDGVGERVYVGSFGEGVVTVIDVNPDAPHAATVEKRIGVRP